MSAAGRLSPAQLTEGPRD